MIDIALLKVSNSAVGFLNFWVYLFFIKGFSSFLIGHDGHPSSIGGGSKIISPLIYMGPWGLIKIHGGSHFAQGFVVVRLEIENLFSATQVSIVVVE